MCLQQTNDGNYGKLDMEPQPPITIEADNCWNFKLDKGDIESGWYSIVCCVVFRAIPETIKSLIIDPKQYDANKRSVYMGKTCNTVAGYDELSQIPLETPTRLRLHRQMEVQEKGYIDLSIKLESEAPQDFELHYVELELGQKQTPGEIVIYGEGKPEQVIHVHHDTNNGSSPQKTLSVHAFDTSFNGSYAATLCFDEDQKKAIFDIWSLYDPAKQGTPRTSKLLARGAINAVPSAHADFADICLSVSDSGTTVVVHSQEATNGIPCHVMSYSPFVPIDSDFASQTWVLTKQSMCETLTGFFGYGNFHYTSMVNPHLKDERYITFDGKSVCVYNTVGAWTRIRTIHLGHDLNLAAGVSLVPSLRGRYFAWTGSQGIVSVWDFETGSQVSHIKVESDALGAFVNLSRDGALVVVSSKSAISVFETRSGVKLGEYQQGLGDSNYFEVIPEGEHIMILDGMSEDDSNDIVSRKIVSTRDMSITRTFQVHKDYDVRFPLTCCSSHMLTYRQGSVVNIMRADNSLISAPKKTFEPESVTDMSVDLHASKTTWEYTSHSGTTFTMSTTISVIHGNWMSILSMTCQSDSSESLALPVGSSHLAYPSIFFPESSRLVMVTGRYLQIWRLEGGTTPEQFELELVWVLQEEDEVRHPSSDICVRNIRRARGNTSGTQIELSLTSPAWFRRLRRLPDDPYERNEATITIPVSESDTLSIPEEYRVRHGIRGVVDMYMNGDSKCQKRAIQYLRTLVRPCSAHPISCIVTLCRLWKSGEKTYFEQIISELLPVDKITWVPNTNGDESANPLAILIKRAETEPNTIGVAKVIMEYCVSHANSARNLSFLAPIFESMNDLMTLFPHEL
ncbi:MAG: hypothetical protein J3Q66DRAFT_391765 [Benniella sp.]|nr:MAG: hypothetical protein J3Q66DRAFT_391765 [Benniella sp.]